MSVELALTLTGCVAVASLVVALLALGRAARASRDLHRVTEDRTALARRVADLEEERLAGAAVAAPVPGPLPDVVADEHSYVITRLGEDEDVPVAGSAPTMEARTFADILAKETVVRSAGLAHGLRRAFAPETRNRIRFEMRREVKRSKRDRKVEMKQAWREYQARQRAQVRLEGEDVA